MPVVLVPNAEVLPKLVETFPNAGFGVPNGVAVVELPRLKLLVPKGVPPLVKRLDVFEPLL